MPGCWGSVNRYEKDLIARVDGASSQQEALDLFRATNQARQEFEKEFKAVPVSKLTASQKDWAENYCEEIISK
jgi:hypothetical protein